MISRLEWTTARSSGFLRVTVAAAVFFAAATLSAEPRASKLRIAQDRETVKVLNGDREVLEYRSIPSPCKPYVTRLFSPGGVQVLRDSPSDHKHHHALMFALAADKVNFWEETAGAGTEVGRSLKILQGGDRPAIPGVGFTQVLDWMRPGDDRPLMTEFRTLKVRESDGVTATLVTWGSRLTAGEGRSSVELSGAHYFGLGMRFVESMDRGGRFFNADSLEGEVVRGSERLTPVRWCAYAATAGDRPVTVALFDHPSNTRHPARMFSMTTPFAYLAATLNLSKEPITLGSGAPLDLVYGVALWDGTAEPAEIEALYRQWAR
jgi:hypothetical protein